MISSIMMQNVTGFFIMILSIIISSLMTLSLLTFSITTVSKKT
jgi:hypothetical protein